MYSKWYDKKHYGDNWKPLSKSIRTEQPRCSKCNRIIPLKNLQVDHIIPISRKGKTIKSNLDSKCYWCHKKKTSLSKPKQFPRGKCNIGKSSFSQRIHRKKSRFKT